MLTQSMTPNQISAASGPTTGASTFRAIGATIGTSIKAISKKSNNNATTKHLTFINISHPPHTPRHATGTLAVILPTAAASVGVARASIMVPSTTKISTVEGMMPIRHLRQGGQAVSVRACFGTAGT